MSRLVGRLVRLPLPLLFALVVATGAAVKLLLNILVVVPYVSWDPRYSAFNGTHVYQTGPMLTTSYKTLILGYGTAYFRSETEVFYLHRVFRYGRDGDLGRYLPAVMIIESGPLPTNTYIGWTDPYSGRIRKLYLVSGTNRAYVIGHYHWENALSVAGIPLYYVVDGNMVRFYPMEFGAVRLNEACSILRSSGLTGTYYDLYSALDDGWLYDCLDYTWVGASLGYESAGRGKTVSLYPDPPQHIVTVNVGNSVVKLVLNYWYAVRQDPGNFIVKVG